MIKSLNKLRVYSDKQLMILRDYHGRGYDVTSLLEFDIERMEEAGKWLENDLDIVPYSKLLSALQLYQIRLGLVSGIDVSEYADPRINESSMRRRRISIMANDSSVWHKSEDVIKEIEFGLQDGLDVSKYIDRPAPIMKQIRLAMLHSVDLSPYGHDASQLREIRLGLQEGLDVESYLKFDAPRMRLERIRLYTAKMERLCDDN